MCASIIKEKFDWYIRRIKTPTRVILGKDDVEDKQKEKGWPNA
jgi:hypothetical protein